MTIIGTKKKFWSQVELKYLQRLVFIKRLIQDENYKLVRTSFIDNLIFFKAEKDKLTSFLHDIDISVKTLYDNFYESKSKVDKLRSILMQLILPIIEDSKAYDRIAEIYAINYLLCQKRIKIIELEYGLSNGKHIDCLIQNIENGENILLDFLSINVESNKVENQEKFGEFLIYRIKKKYTEKMFGLQALDYRFKVFPILWIEDKILKENFDFLFDSETILNTNFYMLRGIENITENKFHTVFGPIDEFKYLY